MALARPHCRLPSSNGSPALAHGRANLAPGHGGDGRQAPATQVRLAHHNKRPLIYLAYGAKYLHKGISGHFRAVQRTVTFGCWLGLRSYTLRGGQVGARIRKHGQFRTASKRLARERGCLETKRCQGV